MTPTEQDKLYHFVSMVSDEFSIAIEKFPAPNPNLAALTEEVGELAQAILHIREGKTNEWDRVFCEAVQVAAMAARCALEGDATIGVVPIGSAII